MELFKEKKIDNQTLRSNKSCKLKTRIVIVNIIIGIHSSAIPVTENITDTHK